MVNKGTVIITDVSGNNALVNTSGQLKVDASVVATANISGQVVLISGQPVTGSFTASVSGQPVRISGETVIANVTTNISGQTIYTVSGQNNIQISGQTVSIIPVPGSILVSGEAVRISGQTVYTVSGNNAVQISGQLVAVSGSIAIGNTPNVIISGGALSGVPVSVSGQIVRSQVVNSAGFTPADTQSSISDSTIDPAQAALNTASFLYGFGEDTGFWTQLQVTTSGDGHKLAVSISGQPVTGSFTASVSGQPVLISGQTVVASVQTNISGQTTYLPNDGVNNVVWISGQVVSANVQTNISGQLVAVSGSVAINNVPNVIISGGALSGLTVSISGQPVVASVTTNISGQTVYTVSGNNAVQVSGQTVTVGNTPNVIISGGALSGLTVSISGQPVVASVTTNISGQVVAISGSVIYLVDDSVNNKIKISGQLVAVSGVVNVGNTVTVNGNVTAVSGSITSISGQVIYLIDDSVNNKTKISGQLVAVSGVVTVNSLPLISVSGNSIYTVSGNNAIQISGQLVVVSGVVRLDPSFSHVSGDAIRFTNDSVNNVVRMSGQLVAVSGVVNVGNAPNVIISGGAISGVTVRISGQPVQVSGESVRMGIPTIFRTRAVLTCTAASGGSVCLSGDVRKATFINAGVSGQNIWLGSATDPPFSGKGIYLTPGNGITIEIDNFATIQACSVVSGALLSYGGEAY